MTMNINNIEVKIMQTDFDKLTNISSYTHAYSAFQTLSSTYTNDIEKIDEIEFIFKHGLFGVLISMGVATSIDKDEENKTKKENVDEKSEVVVVDEELIDLHF